MDLRKSENEAINDLEKLKEKLFCTKHEQKMPGFFFCGNHKQDEIMCEVCCEKHIREHSNLGNDEIIKNFDYAKHSIFYAIHYLYKKIKNGLEVLNKIYLKYSNIMKIASSANNYDKLIDYNYFYLNNTIDEKHNELVNYLLSHKKLLKKRLKIENDKVYKNELLRINQ